VRAIIVAGSGRHFSAGADIGELERMRTPKEFRGFIDALQACFAQGLTKPSVAAIQASPTAAAWSSRSPKEPIATP
jgi:enoyl-CoA hydratase